MERLIRAISPRVEFTIVILIAFGSFMFSSVLMFISPRSGAPISESHLISLIIYEPIAMLVLWRFLSWRDWTFQQVGFVPSIKDSGIGVGIFAGTFIVHALIWVIAGHYIIEMGGQANKIVMPNLSASTVIVVSILNPIFEEVFVCGYVITALKKVRSMSFAINVSVGIRLTYHLYQGVVGIIGILPLGIIFAYWYAKKGRCWPLVVAHGLFDFIGLMMYAKV